MNDYYLSFEISPHNEGELWRPLDALEVAELARKYGVSQATYHNMVKRWKKEQGEE